MGKPDNWSDQSNDAAVKLCHSIIQGDSQAENEFVKLYYQWLLFIVRKKFRNTDLHLDIVQDAFILVITKLKDNQIKQHHTIKAYLRTCAINIGYEYLRKNQKYTSAVDQEYLNLFDDGNSDVLSQLQWQEGVDYVKDIIEQLPQKRDRQIINLFYFEDQDKSYICQQLELTPAHFDRVIYRAKQRLKAKIEAENGSNDDFTTPDKQAKRDIMNDRKTKKQLLSKIWHCVVQCFKVSGCVIKLRVCL